MNRVLATLTASAAAVAGSCDSDAVQAPAASYFLATIQAELTNVQSVQQWEYSGTGVFGHGTQPWGTIFTISSQDNSRGVEESFIVRRFDGPRPDAATYDIDYVPRRSEDAHGFGAQYFMSGDTTALFIAESGELVITRSTPEYVEGRFTFEGFRYCLRTRNEDLEVVILQGPCSTPDMPLSDAPRITVTGTFGAVLPGYVPD